MVSDLREILGFLRELGFLNVVLPFLFVFVIVFGMLEKTRVLGTENGKPRTNLNSMAAFVIGFIFISFSSLVESLLSYLQYIGMALVFVTAVLFAVSSYKEHELLSKKTIFNVLVLIFIIIGFLYSLGIFNTEDYSFILDLIFNPVVIIAVVFYLLIMYITKDGGVKKTGEKKAEEDAKKNEPVKKELEDKDKLGEGTEKYEIQR